MSEFWQIVLISYVMLGFGVAIILYLECPRNGMTNGGFLLTMIGAGVLWPLLVVLRFIDWLKEPAK